MIVPFGELLAQLMPDTPELRMRRDFEKLLSCVKTIAFLRQCQRQKTPGCEIIATIDDYAVAGNGSERVGSRRSAAKVCRSTSR